MFFLSPVAACATTCPAASCCWLRAIVGCELLLAASYCWLRTIVGCKRPAWPLRTNGHSYLSQSSHRYRCCTAAGGALLRANGSGTIRGDWFIDSQPCGMGCSMAHGVRHGGAWAAAWCMGCGMAHGLRHGGAWAAAWWRMGCGMVVHGLWLGAWGAAWWCMGCSWRLVHGIAHGLRLAS